MGRPSGDDDVLHLSDAETREDQSTAVALVVSGILRRGGGQNPPERRPALLALESLG